MVFTGNDEEEHNYGIPSLPNISSKKKTCMLPSGDESNVEMGHGSSLSMKNLTKQQDTHIQIRFSLVWFDCSPWQKLNKATRDWHTNSVWFGLV